MKYKFLDLGRQPITNSFLTMDDLGDEYFYNLAVQFDDKTKLVSLVNCVDPDRMFNDTYAHRASMSKTMRDSFKKVAEDLDARYKPKIVLEIGSNDGVFIKNFNSTKVIAVEPCANLAEKTNKMGYVTYPEYWTRKLADDILKTYGEVDIVYSANTICHIEDLTEIFDAVHDVLSDNGVFVFEDPYLLDVINNTSYDQFYDEHVHIFSVIALDNILRKSGLRIIEVEHLKTHGGSNRICATKTSNDLKEDISVSVNMNWELEVGLDNIKVYKTFAQRVAKSKKYLVMLLADLKEQRKKIVSYGATYKSATVFNYCGIGTNFIDYVTDTTPNKQGKLTPGMHIPIISPEDGFNDTVDYAYLGAWNFVKEITANESEFVKRGGKFITHVPKVHIIGE